MRPRLNLPGLYLQSFAGVRVHGQYRYVSATPDDRQGEGCTVLRLARESPKEPALALIEFADGHRQVVPYVSLRSLREKYPLTPLELLDLGA